MDPKQASSDVDSNTEEEVLYLNDFSVLTQFIYDTSSFSDRLVQLAMDTATEATRAEDHEPAPSLVEAEKTFENKDTESAGNSLYPKHLLIE